MSKNHGEAEKLVCNAQTLLNELKSCSLKKDLQWGRKIHEKAVQNRYDTNKYVVTALIKMYAKCGSMAESSTVFDTLQSPDVVSWNALLLGYADNGQGSVALDMFWRMKAAGFECDPVTYVAAIKACTSLSENGDGNLNRGRAIHAVIGCQLNLYVQNTLIHMYAKCNSMVDARRVFDTIKRPDVVSWNALLMGYGENGEGGASLELFSRMKTNGVAPNSITYVAVLKACIFKAAKGDERVKRDYLDRGKQIHLEIGSHLNPYVQNTLVDMYAKCGSILEAHRTFECIERPDVVSWNVLILGYLDSGEGSLALDIFSRMKKGSCVPDAVTYIAAVKACTSLAINGRQQDCLEKGRQIHSEIRCRLDSYLQTTLVDMYAKGGSMAEARSVFDGINKPDVVSWTALLLGYAENGEGLVVLELFSKMKEQRCAPQSLTYVAVLKACSCLAVSTDDSGKVEYLRRAREIHTEIGVHLDLNVQSTLIDMYAKFRVMDDARRVFDRIKRPDVVCWTALLLGYAENGEGFAALDAFSRMKARGCVPDSVAYVAALKSCTSLALYGVKETLEWGREIHSEIGCIVNPYIQNTLIDMYAKFGSMLEARSVFDSIEKPEVVSWNVLLLGYADNGEGIIVLELFTRMKSSCEPDPVTYIAVFKACGSTGSLALGRKIQSEIRVYTPQLVTCLVDFYAKCGSTVESRTVFDSNPATRDVATWNSLLAGYGSSDPDTVFYLFDAMQDQGFFPDGVTFVKVLLCCSHSGLVQKAKEYFEAMPMKYGVSRSIIHYNCMIDALGRGNQLNEAVAVLRGMPCNPDEVTWRALLGACHKWKNFEIGRLAFQSLDMIKRDASAYVLLSHIYGTRGMWEEEDRLQRRVVDVMEPLEFDDNLVVKSGGDIPKLQSHYNRVYKFMRYSFL